MLTTAGEDHHLENICFSKVERCLLDIVQMVVAQGVRFIWAVEEEPGQIRPMVVGQYLHVVEVGNYICHADIIAKCARDI